MVDESSATDVNVREVSVDWKLYDIRKFFHDMSDTIGTTSFEMRVDDVVTFGDHFQSVLDISSRVGFGVGDTGGDDVITTKSYVATDATYGTLFARFTLVFSTAFDFIDPTHSARRVWLFSDEGRDLGTAASFSHGNPQIVSAVAFDGVDSMAAIPKLHGLTEIRATMLPATLKPSSCKIRLARPVPIEDSRAADTLTVIADTCDNDVPPLMDEGNAANDVRTEVRFCENEDLTGEGQCPTVILDSYYYSGPPPLPDPAAK
jgi:hypothetical protein